jgi:excisionase family DNA binding protein
MSMTRKNSEERHTLESPQVERKDRPSTKRAGEDAGARRGTVGRRRLDEPLRRKKEYVLSARPWREAQQIREYVRATQELFTKAGMKLAEDSELTGWIEFALGVADRIDPLAALQKAIARSVKERAEPCHECGAVRPPVPDAGERDDVAENGMIASRGPRDGGGFGTRRRKRFANPRMRASNPTWIVEMLEGLPPLLTTAEATTVLRMSRRHLYRLVAAGRLFRIRPNGSGSARLLIPRESVEAYLRSLYVT